MQNYYETSKILVDVLRIELNKLRQKLTDQEASRSQRQVDDVAVGRYDHIVERATGQGLSR